MPYVRLQAPPLGQRFVDHEGVHWLVRNVMINPKLDGFFLVCLEHGRTAECAEGRRVLAPSEYEALIRSRALLAVAPDVAQPVSVAGLRDPALPLDVPGGPTPRAVG
jgi:hypothetical protein